MELFAKVLFIALLGLAGGQLAPLADFRQPSVPLVTMDPYQNVWCLYQNLYDELSMYWTSTYKPFIGIIRIDGEAYRFLGSNTDNVEVIGALHQQSVTVWPTRTIYQFLDPLGKVSLSVQFMTPTLPRQWDISSRPVTYISFNISSIDGSEHIVQMYFDHTAELAADNFANETVAWSRFEVSHGNQVCSVMQIGTVSQNYLGKTGDSVGINWGYAYLAVAQDASTSTVITCVETSRQTFVSEGTLPMKDDDNVPRPVDDNWPGPSVAWNFTLGASSSISKNFIYAYDDIYSIEYFGQRFQPYWRRPATGATIETLLVSAIADYPSLLEECEQFDTQLVRDMEAKGGAEYATLAALAYRQTTAATKLVWNDQLQTPWVFFKEISSGGEISTVDLIASASPFFLYNDPEFLKLALLPILAYANNETTSSEFNYTFNWAPHALGTYPVANIHSDQQQHMPIEESGNMLIMLAAITQKLGPDSTALWYPRYWPLIQSWADYLVSNLPDPPDQYCSDDFEGSSPHNANLAIKGIVGVGAFAELCRFLDLDSDHDYYASQASSFASQWMDLANDSDHYRRQYDLDNTWSLKYNLLFDKLLGLGLFPPDVISTEVSYYLASHFNTYGIPLDDRHTYTKLDWTAWVAAMSSSTSQQAQIFETLYKWASTTPDMKPFTDWYDTVSGKRNGYTARPVVGALYALMLV